MKRRRKELLIQPVKPETPEQIWARIKPTFQRELADIVACEGLPISKQAQSLEDEDPAGFLTRICCSDDDKSDGEEERLLRKQAKKNRYC